MEGSGFVKCCEQNPKLTLQFDHLPLNYPPEIIKDINMIAPKFAKSRCGVLKNDATRTPV
jgi:hypothetical protein